MRIATSAFVSLLLCVAANAEGSSLPDTSYYQAATVRVTASRMTGSWLSLPIAVSAISLPALQPSRGVGFDEFLAAVPGVLAQSRYGNQDVRLVIRGYGARGAGERSNSGTSRGVRVMLDGFPETEPDGRTSFDLVEFASAREVEIVRSNSSAVWGNAAGGVVNLRSNLSFEQPFASTQTTFGSFGYRKDVAQTGWFTGPARLLLAFTNTSFDGWREHSASSRSWANISLLSPLGPSTILEMSGSVTSSLFHIPGPLTQTQFDANPKQAQDDTTSYKPTYVQRDERRFNRLGRLGVRLNHKISEPGEISCMFYINPKFLQRSERNTFRDFTRYHLGGSASYSHSWQAGSSIWNRTMAGIDQAYQDGAILFYGLENGQRGETLKTNKREGAYSSGMFVQNEMSIDSRYTVTAGLRYDRLTYNYDDFISSNLNSSKAFDQVTPKLGMSCLVTQEWSIYVALGGGFEAPAGNETDPPSTFGEDTVTAINPLLDPISSTTIELGTKGSIVLGDESFVRDVVFDIATYLINVKNDLVPYRGGRFYLPAGKTRRIGFEVGLSARLDYGLSLRSAVTLARNTYEQYTVDSVHYSNPGSIADYSDNRMAGAPGLIYNASLRYSPSLPTQPFAELSINGVGTYFADDANRVEVDPYDVINASAGFEQLRILGNQLHLRAVVGVNNLTDSQYAESAYINPDKNSATGEPIYLEPGLPRNWFGTFSLNWAF